MKKKYKPFTERDDEVIMRNIEDDEKQCVVEGLRKSAEELDRTLSSVSNRYYKKRGVYRPLFNYNGKNSTYNTKNCGGRGKGRSDLRITSNICNLKYQTITINFKL